MSLAVVQGWPVILTLPKDSAASSTKWEVNIKRKYRVASSAIVLRIAEVLSPAFFDRITKRMVNVKAKKSEVSTFSGGGGSVRLT